jgi:hypothetical protein
VKSKASLVLALGFALPCAPALAGPGGVPMTALAKLARTGEVSCEPALPYFCGNTHVSCSGQTPIRTFRFKLRAGATHGWIDAATDTEGMREQYRRARLEWDVDGAYVVFLPNPAKGYIKLHADGSYSFRHYAQDVGAMSHGHCG